MHWYQSERRVSGQVACLSCASISPWPSRADCPYLDQDLICLFSSPLSWQLRIMCIKSSRGCIFALASCGYSLLEISSTSPNLSRTRQPNRAASLSGKAWGLGGWIPTTAAKLWAALHRDSSGIQKLKIQVLFWALPWACCSFCENCQMWEGRLLTLWCVWRILNQRIWLRPRMKVSYQLL